MELERSSGILVHITSLPSLYGIGDIGQEAYKFIDILVETKQKLWQILPICPTTSPSPYSSISAFGGHSWLISPDKLIEDNYLSKDDLKSINQSKLNNSYVNFNEVKKFKEELLKKAYENFLNNNKQSQEILNEFFQREKYWIDDFTLFMTIKEKYENDAWCDWPEPLRRREESALEMIRQINKDRIQYYLFVQYIFHSQWFQLKKYANDSKIKIVGDMPIYVDYNSADVWSNTDLFQLDHQDTMKPTVLAGFPADHSSTTVQNWNMPIYNWNDENIKPRLFNWWIKRLKKTLSFVDLLRIDHFRGLESHYVIPVNSKTQIPIESQAHWVKTPGYEFFTAITNELGSDIPLICEDLGDVTEEVFALRDHFKFHGVKILQMGFYYDPDNMYCPHHYNPHSIAYTGTHDNPTTLEWWTKKASSKEKEQFIEYIRRPIEGDKELINNIKLEKHVDKHICWYFIQMIMQSSSNGALFQIQDLLNVETRMNEPGIPSDIEHDGPQNWSWRFQWSDLTTDIRNRLTRLTQMYGRDLKYGKSIPPNDMIMKDESKCIVQ
ncbi:unnamed protein product [Adineta steineri]|uniref:4-alpha-glucanotransferase n=1 Tax=Adineta steineri TaxID=433720 RepID=A0A814WAJ2_9BILA|nr:unnamed protein product [Adineta steineri]CAF3918634.1 unnamed protein product [Adineta steineri]